MMASRGMGAIAPSKMPKAKTIERKDDPNKVTMYKEGGKVKSKVNEAGAYTKPGMRKSLFESIKARAVQGTGAGQWSARKAQLLAKQYKAKGGGYKGKTRSNRLKTGGRRSGAPSLASRRARRGSDICPKLP